MTDAGKAQYVIQDGIARLTYTGALSFELLVDIHSRVAADPDFYPEIPKLIDLRKVTEFHTLDEFFRVIAVTAKLHVGATKRKIATVSEDIMVEKIARLYGEAARHSGQATQVEYAFFTSIDAAEKWLKNMDKK